MSKKPFDIQVRDISVEKVDFREFMGDFEDEVSESMQQREDREIELNKLVSQVVENTAYLPQIVNLIRKNNEINTEMLELFKEINEVLKAKNKEEAESIIKSVVLKAKDLNDGVAAMSSLINYGTMLIKFMF